MLVAVVKIVTVFEYVPRLYGVHLLWAIKVKFLLLTLSVFIVYVIVEICALPGIENAFDLFIIILIFFPAFQRMYGVIEHVLE